MFDNIKKRISEQTKDVVVRSRIEDDDTAIVAEYAHLFQELSDLTMEGDGDSRSIELLLDGDGRLDTSFDTDDDIELEELGYNIATGTIDAPSDAAITTSYANMKSEDDFYKESAELFEFNNETSEEFESRRQEYTNKSWMKYRQHVLQEGAFGYKRVNAVSDNVPSMATINFGEYKGSAYNVRLPINHQVDKNGNLTRHQLESIYLAESCGLCSNLMGIVKDDLCDRYHISESASVWDTVVPSILVTPVDPIDKHSIIVGFKNDANLSGMDFYRFTNPVCEYDTSNTILQHSAVERLDNDKVRQLSKFCITKNAAIKESNKLNPCFHRYVQEAINIGGEDNQQNNPPAPDGTSTNDSGMTSNNQNAAPSDDNQDDVKKVTVQTNDVSDAIAQGAEDATTNNSVPDEGTDAPTDIPEDAPALDDSTENSDDSGIESTDMSSTPDGMDDVDKQLSDLDATGAEDAALNGDGNLTGDEVDISQLSIQDLINRGTESLKSMTIDELKEFLANHDNAAAAVQEAFILTNANINDEVDVLLRKTLGVLNDNKMEINKLVSEFKKYGKKLNRVLTKASKATKVYNNNEIDNIKKLNKCLADLLVTIKASTDKSSIQVIKRLMKAFTSQAAVVGKIVEKKKKELPKAEVKESKKKAVQESYTYMSNFLDYMD